MNINDYEEHLKGLGYRSIGTKGIWSNGTNKIKVEPGYYDGVHKVKITPIDED
jgi:hypothetical protein